MANEFIKWNDIYSVGIEKIDEQHIKLIEIINKLFYSFSEGRAEKIVPEILEELSQYTKYHFKTEEDLFEKFQYDEKDIHIEKHKNFIKKVSEWSQKGIIKNSNIHYEMMEYLKKWLLEHILQDDKRYGEILKDKI